MTTTLGNLLRQSRTALVALVLMTVLLGLVYPAVVYGVGRLVPGHADGAGLIGQTFTGDEWFRSRPSAAGDGYDPLASSATNLGPADGRLLGRIEERRAEIAAADGTAPADVAPDAVTSSASGLDPDISPENARQQVARVAAARGVPPQEVEALVAAHTRGRELGFLGEPTVDVLELNTALETLKP